MALLFCGTAAPEATAQTPLTPARIGEIRLDGRLDDPAWLGATRLPFVQFAPTAGAPPSDSTIVLLGYDETHLYVAGRFHAEPGSVQSTSLTRDRVGADDLFRLMLDTFDDNTNAVLFVTTPAGTQIDYAISQDGQAVTDSWNTFWDVRTTRDDEGWTMELRIPLSSLRFEPVEGSVTMGLIASRYSARRNELTTFPGLDPRTALAAQRPPPAARSSCVASRPGHRSI